MQGFVLSRPGDVSEQIPLRAYAATCAREAKDDKGLAAQWRIIEGYVEQLEVRVRVCTDAQVSLWGAYERMAGEDDDIAEVRRQAHAAVLKDGLVSVHGAEGAPCIEVSPDLLEQLAASGLQACISMLIQRYQSLSAKERAGFFTQAQEG